MLPADYEPRTRAASLDTAAGSEGAYWTPERIANAARYQLHVYRWADRVAHRRGLRRVLDAGCGVGTKLVSVLGGPDRELWGVDQESALGVARRISPGARYWAADLESPESSGESPATPFDLIVCADVLEHLENPDPLMAFLRARTAPGGRLVLSTPDRDRLRGRDCRRSLKPDHVREWSRTEFAAYVASRGFEVLSSRLMPQDETPIGPHLAAEFAFRLGVRPRSPLACHAVLCRPA